jgi:hypothetical protein
MADGHLACPRDAGVSKLLKPADDIDFGMGDMKSLGS